MFEGIGNLITTLFEGLDIRRRWMAIIAFVVLFGVCLLVFEQMTGTVYYSSLERKTELLKELNALEKEGNISSSPELKKVYDQTVRELSLRSIKPFSFPSVVFVSAVMFWKVFTGAGLGIIFALFFALQRDKSNSGAILGALAFGVLGGFVGGMLPVIYSPSINYVGLPIIELVFLALLGRRSNKGSATV